MEETIQHLREEIESLEDIVIRLQNEIKNLQQRYSIKTMGITMAPLDYGYYRTTSTTTGTGNNGTGGLGF